MFTLPSAKRFRKQSRIANLTVQLNSAKHIVATLAKVAHMHHHGLTELRECFLSPSEDIRASSAEGGYVWNGDKPAPEMILDIAERVENIFIRAGLDPALLEKKIPAENNGDQPVSNLPASTKV